MERLIECILYTDGFPNPQRSDGGWEVSALFIVKEQTVIIYFCKDLKWSMEGALFNKANAVITCKITEIKQTEVHCITTDNVPLRLQHRLSGTNMVYLLQQSSSAPNITSAVDISKFTHVLSFKPREDHGYYPINQFKEHVYVFFDVKLDESFSLYTLSNVRMTLRTPKLVFKGRGEDQECQEVNVKDATSFVVKFSNVSYCDITEDASLLIELFFDVKEGRRECVCPLNINGELNKGVETRKCRCKLMRNGELISGILPLDFVCDPVLERTDSCPISTVRVLFNSLERVVLHCPVTQASENRTDVFNITKFTNINESEFTTVNDRDTAEVIRQCRSLSIRKQKPSDLELKLFEKRYHYLTTSFSDIGFWVLRATQMAELETGIGYLEDAISFVKQKMRDRWPRLPFPRILPYFAHQTNCDILQKRIGEPLFNQLMLDDIIQHIPFIAEMLKRDARGAVIDHIIDLAKSDKTRAEPFIKGLVWEIASNVRKNDENYSQFQGQFEKLLTKAIRKDQQATIKNDIELVVRLVSDNNNFITLDLWKDGDMDDPSKYQSVDMSLPFIDARITNITKRKVYKSATNPEQITVITTKGDEKTTFMVKKGDDLLNDKLILVLSKYIYQELKENGQIDMQYTTYSITEMGNYKGVVQFIPDVEELESFLSSNDPESFITGHTRNGSLTTEEQLTLMLNLSKSFAMCCVLNYMFMIRDRHPHNYMIQKDTGKVFHIDFGFIFGRGVPWKGFEPEVTIFNGINELIKKYHLEKSFHQYAYWAWNKVKELSQDIITLFAIICYGTIDPKEMDRVEKRIMESDFETFKEVVTQKGTVTFSEVNRFFHNTASYLK